MMNLKVTLFLTLILYGSGVSAQMSISEINLAHQFQENKVYDVQMHGLKDDQEATVFVSYKLPDTLNMLRVSFWGARDYEQPVLRIDSLLREEVYLGEHEGRHYYQYQLNTAFPLIALELVTGENTSEIYDLYFDEQQLDITLFRSGTNIPVIERWVRDKEYYEATNLKQDDEPFQVSLYKYNFESAAPPMVVNGQSEMELRKDSAYSISNGNAVTFDQKGYYLFQKDTLSHRGYGWRMHDDAFPKYNQVAQLIPPLKYITTPDEYKKISADMNKKSFDNFWLKIGKSPGSARSMLGKYYKRVEEANRLFTSYKDGWKTDKGMVYIVFGPPHQVKRTGKNEVWWYFDGDDTRQVFQFLRFSHIFYPNNYVLLRDQKYRRSWFTAVDMIRNNRY